VGTRILSIVGARPQFIKAAPLSRVIADRSDIKEIMVHTGQHFDQNMSAIFFHELSIAEPHYTLGIHGGSHGEMTGRMIIALERIMIDLKPKAVLIYGDTNSTLAGAVAAAKLYIPIAHVEAGLRSFRKMPEEVNRIVADRLSRWLFCPTKTAVTNLLREGVDAGVHRVGDVMYDAALFMRERARCQSRILDHLGLSPGRFQLATVHRAENTDTREALDRVLSYLQSTAHDQELVLPLHPRTRNAAAAFGIELSGIKIIEPVGYLDMLALLDGCTRVLTDSGGLQKEAYFFRKPCITLRDATEWVETVEAGWNRLWITPDYKPRRDIDAYGNGDAARTIVDILVAEV
jgi:UDP-GlcNAc3NAcA epimerase